MCAQGPSEPCVCVFVCVRVHEHMHAYLSVKHTNHVVVLTGVEMSTLPDGHNVTDVELLEVCVCMCACVHVCV